MTTKIKAITAAWITATFAFIAWLMTIPPEQQGSLLGPLVDLTPIEYRGLVGFVTRLLASISTIYAVYSAAHSGPQSPPVNPPK